MYTQPRERGGEGTLVNQQGQGCRRAQEIPRTVMAQLQTTEFNVLYGRLCEGMQAQQHKLQAAQANVQVRSLTTLHVQSAAPFPTTNVFSRLSLADLS